MPDMAEDAPYGGARLIADTSAWTAIRRSKALKNTPPEWTQAVFRRQLLTSPIVRLELLHSVDGAQAFEDLDHLLGHFDEVPVSSRVFTIAITAVRELALRGKTPGYHRVGLADALIAASAHDRSVGVLHYNHKDFEKLSTVLSFKSVPLARAGTFER
jgi:predicted nucleic acid-binding protein